MPSVNLVWEQKTLRKKLQGIAMVLLALMGVAVLVIGQEVVRTRIAASRCLAQIEEYDKSIEADRGRAQRNEEMQGRIAALQPVAGLLQEAQRITLRWVCLLSELDNAVPDPRRVALNQLGFGVAVPTGDGSANVGVIGDLTISGAAADYPSLAQAYRNLVRQPHIGEVRLQQIMADPGREGGRASLRFGLQAQFRIPEDEEKVMVASVEAQAQGTDRAAAPREAGEGTAPSRVPSAAASP